VNYVWDIDTFNSGENDGCFVDVDIMCSLNWPVDINGLNRRRGRTGCVAEAEEKD
jgi:hypothetical protein